MVGKVVLKTTRPIRLVVYKPRCRSLKYCTYTWKCQCAEAVCGFGGSILVTLFLHRDARSGGHVVRSKSSSKLTDHIVGKAWSESIRSGPLKPHGVPSAVTWVVTSSQKELCADRMRMCGRRREGPQGSRDLAKSVPSLRTLSLLPSSLMKTKVEIRGLCILEPEGDHSLALTSKSPF